MDRTTREKSPDTSGSWRIGCAFLCALLVLAGAPFARPDSPPLRSAPPMPHPPPPAGAIAAPPPEAVVTTPPPGPIRGAQAPQAVIVPGPPVVVGPPPPPPLPVAMRIIYAPFYAAGLVLRYGTYYLIVAPLEVLGRTLSYGVDGGVQQGGNGNGNGNGK